jgi:predicted MPP superfamily phosphohydrolase
LKMRMSPKKFKAVFGFLLLLIGLLVFIIFQNNNIVTTESDYYNPKIPIDFNGFKIVHISDLHNKMFGAGQRVVLNKVRLLSPDIIVITGDLVDRRKYDLNAAMVFISGAVKIAPVYYVSGNHEAWSGNYLDIEKSLTDAGVHMLDDVAIEISKGKSSIQIMGVADPDFLTSSYLDGTNTSNMMEQLNKWSEEKSFKILLSHRPELFYLYYENNMDLVFTGHAHGGQIRIPLLGGLIAPDQGLLPEYTSGSYRKGSTTMYVSRGLGNSIIPVRLFNRPEIVSVTLKSNK